MTLGSPNRKFKPQVNQQQVSKTRRTCASALCVTFFGHVYSCCQNDSDKSVNPSEIRESIYTLPLTDSGPTGRVLLWAADPSFHHPYEHGS